MDFKEIKTYEDALAAVGGATEDQKVVLEYEGTDEERLQSKYRMQLSIIAKAIKLGDEPIDWSDGTWKHFPVFRNPDNAGFGFSFSHAFYDRSRTVVGSRHSFASEEKSDYFGKQFIELHNKVLMFN